MFKSKITKELFAFADDIFSLFGVIFGVMLGLVLLIVLGAFAYQYYPTLTLAVTSFLGVTWILGVFFTAYPISRSKSEQQTEKRDKKTPTINIPTDMPKCLTANNERLNKLQKNLWQSFKEGFDKGRH